MCENCLKRLPFFHFVWMFIGHAFWTIQHSFIPTPNGAICLFSYFIWMPFVELVIFIINEAWFINQKISKT